MIRFLSLNAFIAIHTIVLCFWGLIISLFDRSGRILHRYAAVPWAKTILFVCGVKVRVLGMENLDKESPHIYLSNHQSYFDIFTLLAGLPVNFKFLLKQELMDIPLLGLAMRRTGYISIDRGDVRKALTSMNKAADKIKNGASVLIFPEGTRSEDGNIRSFKRGGFHLAIKSGCDLVPVAIANSRAIVPKGSLRINRGTIILNIGRPIPVKDYSKRNMEELIKRAQDTVNNLMKEGLGVGK